MFYLGLCFIENIDLTLSYCCCLEIKDPKRSFFHFCYFIFESKLCWAIEQYNFSVLYHITKTVIIIKIPLSVIFCRFISVCVFWPAGGAASHHHHRRLYDGVGRGVGRGVGLLGYGRAHLGWWVSCSGQQAHMLIWTFRVNHNINYYRNMFKVTLLWVCLESLRDYDPDWGYIDFFSTCVHLLWYLRNTINTDTTTTCRCTNTLFLKKNNDPFSVAEPGYLNTYKIQTGNKKSNLHFRKQLLPCHCSSYPISHMTAFVM